MLQLTLQIGAIGARGAAGAAAGKVAALAAPGSNKQSGAAEADRAATILAPADVSFKFSQADPGASSHRRSASTDDLDGEPDID